MSHVTTVDLVIHEDDLPILKKTADALGLVFNEGKTDWKWYGRWMNDYNEADAGWRRGLDPHNYGKSDHALSVPGNDKAYEVGIVKTGEKEYKFAFDFYCGGFGLCDHVGAKGEKLFQEFGKQKALAKAAATGFKVKKMETLASGQLKIFLGKKNPNPLGGF